jgi:hypothetical protein
MLLRKVWKGWLKFAEVFGNIQMTILLSLIYWVMVPIVAVPFKLLADPLALRRSRRWVARNPESIGIDSMRKQG